MIGIKTIHFERDISLCLASPLNEESDDLLIVFNYLSKTNYTFCRYSESGEYLWGFKVNPSVWRTDIPLEHFKSEFLLFRLRSHYTVKQTLLFVSLSDGKVHKILGMPEIAGSLLFVELCGSRIAIQANWGADVYIYIWRSGVMLTKLSQIFEIPLNEKGLNCFSKDSGIALRYSFQHKRVFLFTEGYLYSATFKPNLTNPNLT